MLGLAAVITAIQQPGAEGRWMVLVLGSIFALIGVALALSLRSVLRTRRYTFTETALQGQTHTGRAYTLPWSAVESMVMEARKREPLWRMLL